MPRHTIVFVLLAILGVAFWALMTGYTPDAELNRSALYYAQNTAAETGAQNIVAAIIVTYRGLDTLGEVTVLFLTAAIVGLVLSHSYAPQKAAGPGILPPGELLTTGARILVPMILLFGAYVFINGHLTPGGGFQGGAILASGAVLALLADPTPAVQPRRHPSGREFGRACSTSSSASSAPCWPAGSSTTASCPWASSAPSFPAAPFR